MKLLTLHTPKTDKARRYGCLNAILYLSPGGWRCEGATKGCLKACLNTAGRGRFAAVQAARRKRTEWMKTRPATFMVQLIHELEGFQRRAEGIGLVPVVRLNGTSDLTWWAVYEGFPGIQFVEYTKIGSRLKGWRPYKNLTLNFSRSEVNERECLEVLELGLGNVAVVFSTKKGERLPLSWKGWPVIDGDLHDLRQLDPKGCVVGLRAKGKARKDKSGFVVQVEEGR